MVAKKLTETAVSKMAGKRLRDTEIRGFVVETKKTGKFFYLEFQSPVTQQYRKHPLGRWGDLTVAAARELAKITSGEVAKGIDPQQRKHLQRAEFERQKQETLRAFLAQGYKQVTPEKTMKDVVPRIEKHFPEYLDMPMTSITAWNIEKWKRAYSGKPSGGNRILNSLKGILSKAVKAGVLEKSPLAGIKDLKQDRNKKINYLTEIEEQRLMEAVEDRQLRQREERRRYIQWCIARGKEPPESLDSPYTDHVMPMIVVKLNTGLRSGELFNLRVGDIDLSARLLTVVGEGAKSGQTRQIYLNELAFEAIVTWLNQTGNKGLLFPSPVTGEEFDNIKTVWSGLRAKAGLPGLRLHDLRHTFGTRLAHQRVDLVTIKDLMGHESLDTTARYLHTSNELKMKAVMSLQSDQKTC
ncbi:MAG: tyrosine-type recombinase/integrase [Endozoicomonas sp.]